MKKKFITLALSMVLCLSMGMTALAAPSPSVGSKQDLYAALGVAGASESAQQKAIVDLINKAVPNGAKSVLHVGDPQSFSAPTNDDNGVDVEDSTAEPNQDGWYLLHFKAGGDTVDVLPAYVSAKGKVTTVNEVKDFSYFTPVRVATIASTTPGQVPGSGNAGPGGQGASNSTNGPASAGSASGSGSTAAPKTGDFATPIVAEVVALLSVAGIALYVKKSAAR